MHLCRIKVIISFQMFVHQVTGLGGKQTNNEIHTPIMQNICKRNNQTVKDPGQMSLSEGLLYNMYIAVNQKVFTAHRKR